MDIRKKYRIALSIALASTLLAIGVIGIKQVEEALPNDIKIIANQETEFDFSLPIAANLNSKTIVASTFSGKKVDKNQINLDLQKRVTFTAEKKGKGVLTLKLFGILPIKQINMEVIEDKEVYPCGTTVGIELQTDGVLVLGTGVVKGKDGLNYEPSLHILKSGDYIKSINGVTVNEKESLIAEMQKTSNGNVKLKILRDKELLEVAVQAVKSNEDDYKIGVWVRDDTQGIGTLTYIDEENNFGALGHGITDIDTGELMTMRTGNLYEASILQVVKGVKGTPGELVGYISETPYGNLGKITKNTDLGIAGYITKNGITDGKRKVKIGLKQEVKVGDASVLCQISDSVKEYKIKIEKINWNNKDTNKGMVLRITDKELLKLTNGIVQGMSGSPILQNGKIVGAVTHVFVQDSTNGYGSFIENMISLEGK